jgi:DNA (cytosine-5)-methyltransferase 1
MIGNAVPPNLAKAIGATIFENWKLWHNSKQGQEL